MQRIKIIESLGPRLRGGDGASPFLMFLLGAVFYWAALPPLGFWPLAFLVPACWAVAVLRPQKLRFRTVYFGAFLFWLASIWWIACPHPATFLGLIALSAYLALYWPLFFAASRFVVHRLKIPAVLAMPVCWMGCEYIRNHALGGFSFCSLEHALYRQPLLIQIADISGGYLVGGMVFLVGVGITAKFITKSDELRSVNAGRAELFSCFLSLAVLLITGFYGFISILELPVPYDDPPFRIAVLQGNIPVKLDADPDRATKTYQQFVDLTTQAVKEGQKNGDPVDLVIWPETVCPVPLVTEKNPGDFLKAGLGAETVKRLREDFNLLENFVNILDTPVLIGLSTLEFDGTAEPARLNSALLIDPKSENAGPRYDKVQLVMFGEYIPFSKFLPDDFFLKTLCQEAGRGSGPVAMPLRIPSPLGERVRVRGNDENFTVNICFESTIPHFVRKQTLDTNASFLVNMSNDGWFRFSQQIDQHLATHVFRAVENRRPYVTATNGGFSAIIDAKGGICAIGERGQAQAVVGAFNLDGISGTPIYHKIGDTIPFCCTIFLAFCLVGVWRTRDKRPAEATEGGRTE